MSGIVVKHFGDQINKDGVIVRAVTGFTHSSSLRASSAHPDYVVEGSCPWLLVDLHFSQTLAVVFSS